MAIKTQIAFIATYPLNAVGGQRFRFEQYLDTLSPQNIGYHCYPFFDQKTYSILYLKGKTFQKIIGLCLAILYRFLLLFTIRKYQYVYIYREAIPIGPPIWEFIVAKLFKQKIIIDFDDSVWLAPQQTANAWTKPFRFYSKLQYICKWAYKVSCGNTFLANYAQQFNPNVFIIPTTLDTIKQHNQTKFHSNKPTTVIGWTGSHTTLVYLEPIYPILIALAQKYSIELKIIANQPPTIQLPFLKFIRWSSQSEVDDLLTFDIGIMPLSDTDWEKGKCGFKALQYMSLAIPTVVSPVGVNTSIVEHKQNGLIAANNQDWLECLSQLIESAELRNKLGRAGQQTVAKQYAKIAQTNNFLQLFK